MFERIKLELYKRYKLLSKYVIKYFWIGKTFLFFPRTTTILISFYADYDNTFRYKKAAESLSRKLRKWKIPHIFEQIADQGGYKNNTLFKPTFIYDKISTLKKTVIWIDCDTDPSSPEAIYKMAKFPKPFCSISESGKTAEMQVWLLKFEYEKFSLELLKTWRDYCEIASSRNINELDHEALKDGVLPHVFGQDKIGHIKLKSKKVGFISSTALNVATTEIQSSLIGGEKRKEIFDELMGYSPKSEY
jgi:hypothetical protein